MRRIRVAGFIVALLVAIGLSSGSFRPQTARAQGPGLTPQSVVPVNFAESIPVRDLPADTTLQFAGEDDLERPNRELPRSVAAASTGDEDAAMSPPPPVSGPAPAPLLTFEGLSNADNLAAFGFRLSPPDNDGDIGPNHYVQYINLLFRVFDRTGTPLTPPVRLSTLYAPLGGQCAAGDNGDPIVLYDQLADRWLLSQFAFTSSASPPYHECIAISKTADPAGAYYLYDFVVPTAQFNDYPKIGVWPDGYYMTANQFNRGLAFDGTGAFAFNRKKMLVGDPTANMIYFDLNLTTNPEGIGGMLPSDVDGLTPPPHGAPNVFVYFLATEFLDAIDGLRFFDFHADFDVPANSTFVERQPPLPVPDFDPRSPTGRADIEQPPPALATHGLDAISDRLMFRLAYRNFGSHESLVVNHTVNVTPQPMVTQANHQAGVRYYELRRPGPWDPFAVHVAETIAPDITNRWMGSAAQDNAGNIAVGYSVSSLTTFPGIRYSGRLADGSARTEASIVEGSGVQRSTGSRWGDYTAMAVDPLDDCTFWYTNQYYTAASQATSPIGWLTRIGAFKYDQCSPAPRATLMGTVTNAHNGLPVAGALIDLGQGYMTSTGPDGAYKIFALPGRYRAHASAPNYQSQAHRTVLHDGATTVVDFALVPNGADLFVVKNGPAQAQGGTELTYVLTVGNNGPLAAANVRVNDPTPAGTIFVSAVPSAGTCRGPGQGHTGVVTCNVGHLDVGATATITVKLHSTEPAGTVRNEAHVFAGIRDLISHNNIASITTRLTCGGDITVNAGAIGTAAINGLQTGRLFRNGSPSSCDFPKAFPGLGDAAGARRFDAYQYTNEAAEPACVTVSITAATSCSVNLLYSAAYTPGFNPADISQNFLADSGSSPSPAAGAPTVAYSFIAPPSVPFSLVVHEVNPQPSVPCGGYSFTLRNLPIACGLADLAVSKWTWHAAHAGDELHYSIDAVNNGPRAAANATLTEEVPANTTFVSFTAPAGWTCITPAVGGTGTIACTAASMAAGETAAFTAVVRIGEGLPYGTTISNTVSLRATTNDPNPFNNSATTRTRVR